MKAIYKLNFDCGRQGNLEGIFSAEKEHVDALIESEIVVQFGEALGKHSNVYGSVTAPEITMTSDDPATVEMFDKAGMASGYDPFGQWTGDDMNVLDAVLEYIASKSE